MDNEINPLAKHSQHFSKYAMFYRGIIFEDARSRERQKPAEKGFLPTTARVHPFGSVTDAHGKRTIWGYINDILLLTRMDRNLVPVVHSPRCRHFRMEDPRRAARHR